MGITHSLIALTELCMRTLGQRPPHCKHSTNVCSNAWLFSISLCLLDWRILSCPPSLRPVPASSWPSQAEVSLGQDGEKNQEGQKLDSGYKRHSKVWILICSPWECQVVFFCIMGRQSTIFPFLCFAMVRMQKNTTSEHLLW